MAPNSSRMVPFAAFAIVIGVVIGVTLMRGTPGDVAESSSRIVEAPAPEETTGAGMPGPRQSGSQRRAESDAYLRKLAAARADAGRNAEAAHHAASARFSREQVDASWAAARRAGILAGSKGGQITALQAEPLVLASECRTSTCRIDAEFATRARAQDWLTLFLMNVGAELPHATFEHSTNPDGSALVTVYATSDR